MQEETLLTRVICTVNQEHLDILKQGVDVWNRWRKEHSYIQPELSEANLSGVDLRLADLSRVDLSKAILNATDLRLSDLSRADLSRSNLNKADLSRSHLNRTDLSRAILRDASLKNARLRETNLSGADLSGTDFTKAYLYLTVFGNVDLSLTKGLETVIHQGPSTIGIDTINRSKGSIPEGFLRGVGISGSFLTSILAPVGQTTRYYTCFISYSSRDQDFVNRLYTDLQSNGVRCWFAPEHMKIGDKLRPRIDESIRLYDKLLLVLSEHSITSNWVAYEVEQALNKEPGGLPNVLFPIRLDDTVMKSRAQWADDIRRTRHIGDFTHWKNIDDYQKALIRLLRDLKAV